MTGHSELYRARLASPEWRALRSVVLGIQHGRCKGCGRKDDHPIGTPLELHHRHYRTLGRERPTDLVALCRYCHEVADGDRADETASRVWWARYEGWAEVVGMDPDEPATEEAFEAWLEGRAA